MDGRWVRSSCKRLRSIGVVEGLEGIDFKGILFEVQYGRVVIAMYFLGKGHIFEGIGVERLVEGAGGPKGLSEDVKCKAGVSCLQVMSSLRDQLLAAQESGVRVDRRLRSDGKWGNQGSEDDQGREPMGEIKAR